MRTIRTLLLAVLAAAVFAGCGDGGNGNDIDAGPDSSADTDSDSDTDADTDSDAGTDSDTDTDTDECSDEDTFDPAECPEIGPVDAKVRYVDASIAVSGDGTSWETAFTSVQHGIDACRCVALALGDACQVWVAEGTYPTDSGDLCRSVRLRPNVALYGGFAGGETSLGARDWTIHVTTLNGGGVAQHVVIGASGATIDGFAIEGGNADGSYPEYGGGGMYNLEESPIVENCTFSENSGGSGGGMYNEYAAPIVTGCTFSGNVAIGGAGMFNYQSDPIVTACIFEDNVADNQAGGMMNTSSSPIVEDCAFTSNSAPRGGGMVSESGAPIVTRCVFAGNLAVLAGGGGMFNSSGEPTVTSCVFSGNTAAENGGAMLNSFSSPLVTNCVFVGNSATHAGAMDNSDSITLVTNCTFFGNSADEGGALSFSTFYSNVPTLTNSVFWGDEALSGPCSEICGDAAAEVVTYCDVQGGYAGTGNIDSDPLFVDAASGDLHLQSTSPCIDTGSNDAVPSGITTDLDGNPRIVDGDSDSTATVDMGAYEVQP